MADDQLLTFRQYADNKRRGAAKRHGITIAAATRELPDSIYLNEWRDHVVAAYNNGSDIPKRMWRQLDEGLQWRLRSCTRSLRGNDPGSNYD